MTIASFLAAARRRASRAVGLVALLSAAAAAFAADTPQFFTYYGLGRDFREAHDHVNLHWAVSWAGDSVELKAQLRDARAAGMKAVLHAEFVFFPASCPAQMRPDAAARWRAFAVELAAAKLLDTVVAVYPMDEPDLCGVPDADMQAVIAIIHNEPLTRDKKVAGLFTVDVAKKWGGHYRLTGKQHQYSGSLRAYDWVGFDCYGCNTVFSETAWDTVRFDIGKPGFVTVPGPTLYDNFKSQLDLTRQKLILVPQASTGGAVLGPAYDDAAEFYARARADRDVVLLLPFAWLDQDGGVTGVRSTPALRAIYAAIGRDIDARHPEVSPRRPRRAKVVEFYNPARDHYFVSAAADEIALLDSGATSGWVRTGAEWSVFEASPALDAGAAVCRFYGRPEAGLDSHFYSASASECRSVQERFPGSWLYESGDVFHVVAPDGETGECPLFTTPLHRLYDNRKDANHRFTASAGLVKDMQDQGWISEGYGPEAVAMCVPG